MGWGGGGLPRLRCWWLSGARLYAWPVSTLRTWCGSSTASDEVVAAQGASAADGHRRAVLARAQGCHQVVVCGD